MIKHKISFRNVGKKLNSFISISKPTFIVGFFMPITTYLHSNFTPIRLTI
jgi:hypothetical protein